MMTTRELTVRFTTPAFLGNAEQAGQWRMPPFKHLLREWWRVAWAMQQGFRGGVDAMRREEARLFGAAADGQGNRSLVRLRLERWDEGKKRSWADDPKVRHPEVGRGRAFVGSHLYLGYGPLSYDKATKGTRLKKNAAIQADETNTFKLAFPSADAALLDHALVLIDAYGTLGGRNRNGWGSLFFYKDGKPLSLEERGWAEGAPLRDWHDCLDRDWPHAIGRDGSGAPLVWRTKEIFDDWRPLMRRLAEIKIGLRTHFVFTTGMRAKAPEDRHWLSYPVTNHSVAPWDSEAKRRNLGNRLPNTLRFKARRDENGGLYAVIIHMPHLPPVHFHPDRVVVERVWKTVHAFLDDRHDLERVGR